MAYLVWESPTEIPIAAFPNLLQAEKYVKFLETKHNRISYEILVGKADEVDY